MRKTLIVFAFAILCSSFAGARSTESVCDGEQGAAYGLCNAFCDAMDCDGDDPEASATACNKVKSKFEQVTGHEPPCLTPPVTCPCIEGFPNWIDAVNSPVLECTDIETEGFVFLRTSGTPFSRTPGVQIFPDFVACRFFSGSSEVLSITEPEALACQDFLRARAAAEGVTCQ